MTSCGATAASRTMEASPLWSYQRATSILTAWIRGDGTSAAEASLTEQGITCRSLTVTIETAAFRAGGTVTAALSCTVDLADLTSLSIPSSRTITATFTSPVDQYRGMS